MHVGPPGGRRGRNTPEHARTRRNTPEHAGTRRNTPEHAGGVWWSAVREGTRGLPRPRWAGAWPAEPRGQHGGLAEPGPSPGVLRGLLRAASLCFHVSFVRPAIRTQTCGVSPPQGSRQRPRRPCVTLSGRDAPRAPCGCPSGPCAPLSRRCCVQVRTAPTVAHSTPHWWAPGGREAPLRRRGV